MEIGWEFSKLLVNSMLMGVLGGMLLALILKHARFTTKSIIHQILLLICMGFITYMVSDLFELSGIVTLLAAGITTSHYAWYNLSRGAK